MTPQDVLRQFKNIAVVGLSSDPTRPSHSVSRYMQANGYRILPVNPNELEVLGQKAVATLDDIREPLEIVNVFRLPWLVPPIADSAIRLGARVLWLQEGIVHEEACGRARAAGLIVFQDCCILREHMKL